jgi:hypothetical protein
LLPTPGHRPGAALAVPWPGWPVVSSSLLDRRSSAYHMQMHTISQRLSRCLSTAIVLTPASEYLTCPTHMLPPVSENLTKFSVLSSSLLPDSPAWPAHRWLARPTSAPCRSLHTLLSYVAPSNLLNRPMCIEDHPRCARCRRTSRRASPRAPALAQPGPLLRPFSSPLSRSEIPATFYLSSGRLRSVRPVRACSFPLRAKKYLSSVSGRPKKLGVTPIQGVHVPVLSRVVFHAQSAVHILFPPVLSV